MGRKLEEAVRSSWVGLTRAHRTVVGSVEKRLKEAGLPPLSWYDALLELTRAGRAGLRPFELERAMLFEQYNLSRLIDRLAAAGLVERRDCAEDRRGQRLVVTAAGRALRRRIWEVSSRAVEDAIATKLRPEEAAALAALLTKLQQPAEAGSRREKGGA